MPMTAKEMVKFLKQHGFEEVSQKGSHLKMRNYATGRQTEVPTHAQDLPVGTEKSILKQAGLKK